MKKIIILLALVSMVGLAQAENLLVNADFELGALGQAGSGGANDPTGWGSYGGNGWFWPDAVADQTGNSVKMWWDDTGYFQSIDAVEGDEFIASALAQIWTNYDSAVNWDPTIAIAFWGGGEQLQWTEYTVESDGLARNLWHTVSVTSVAPAGTETAQIHLTVRTDQPTEGGTVYWDNASMELALIRAVSPANQASSLVPADITSLDWFRSPIMPGDVEPQVEVYWGDADANDVNFWDNSTKIMDLADADSMLLANALGGPITIVSNEQYYWALKYENPAGGSLIETRAWSFDTVNLSPIADAGGDFDIWLTSAVSATAALDSAYTDDGLPGAPTFLWTSSPSAGVSFSSAADESPTVTFTSIGNYTLSFKVDDGALNHTDTVDIRVFANGDDRLRVHYTFDEASGTTAYDSDLDDVHDGTLVGGPVWVPAGGQVGGAIQLDGDDDYIEITDTGDPNLLDGDGMSWENTDLIDGMTVSAWVNLPDGWTTAWETIVGKRNNVWEMLRNDGNDTVGFGAWGNVGAGAYSTVQSVSDGQWHHIVGVFARTTVAFYVDGVLEASNDTSESQMVPEAGTILIGASHSSTDNAPGRFSGALIDEVRIYDAALPYASNDPANPSIVGIFAADGGHGCGGVYNATDINQDCYNNLTDFALFASDWLECSDVVNPICN